MTERWDNERRRFLRLAGGAGIAASAPLIARATISRAEEAKEAEEPTEEEVSPAEDLMREHGVLDRVLLIYDEVVGRLETKADFDPAVLSDSTGIIRRFIEDYHEKLEEDQLFPRFERAHTLVDLVGVLREQHKAGRSLTDAIHALATRATLASAEDRAKLAATLRRFNRMYRPHAAREDTVLFPALHRIVSQHEYDSLGEEFEDREHELFGEDGFEKVVDQVAGLERRLGIEDLASFTPKV